MRAIVIFATLTAVVLARPDVSHLNGYKYNQPGGGASNGIAASNSYTNAGVGFSGGNNELESLNNMTDKGDLEELSSTFMGFTSYDAPYVSGNNYQGSYTDSASFGSSASGVTSGAAPLEEVSVQVSSSGSANGIAGSGYSSETTGLDAGLSIGLDAGLSAGSANGLSAGSSNGFSDSSNGAGSSNGFSGSSNGAGSLNGFSGSYNGAGSSNGFSAGSESGSTGNRFSGSSSSSGANGANGNGGINLIQGQSQSFDLTGGSSGGPQRVVYRPVIKQGEPIITKNFYVHAAPEEDENVRVEEKIHVVRPQKTYKIIFIKAPSIGSSLSAANYPVYPQNEEKTIVYVLSKKNDEITDVDDIPTPPPAVTHKPEVFFIKYKTKQEAADAVANIQSQFQQESQSGAAAGTQSLSIGGSSGTQSLSIGGSANGNGGSNLIITSTGSENGDDFDQRITPDDIRDETGDINESAFGISAAGDIDVSGIQTITTSSASSETQVGPTGGHIALQASNFGPTGGQVITQTAQLPAGDALPAVQTQYTEYNGGQTYSQQNQGPAYTSDSSGSGAEFIQQQFINDPNRQAYLPPNARRFRF